MTPLQRFFNLLSVDKQEILSIYVYAVFNGLITLSLPLGIQAIINLIMGGQVSTAWIILVAFVIAGVAFTGILQIMQLTITENLQQKIFVRSAFEFAYRVPRIRLESVDRSYIPELVNRFFDTLSVQKGLSKILIDFSSASLQILFGLILLSLYHPFFIMFSFVLLLIIYLIFRYTAPQGLKTSLKESEYKYEVAHWLEETARAMETFKLAGNSPLPLRKTDEVVSGYLKSRKSHFKTLLVQFANLVGFKVIVAAGLLLIGGLLVINEQMNIGQFVASEIIIILILASVEKLILSMETIYDVLTAIEKIGNITDIPLDSDKGMKVSSETETGLSIKLKDLSYKFSDARDPVLSDLNLNIEAGEKICLSGYSGSGKSLLLQIMAGLYDDFSGTVSYDGIPLGNWSREELHRQIGDSLAKEDIFKATLAENISLGKDEVSFDAIREATEAVGLSSYIETLPEGYNTVMIPEGKNLPKSIRIKIMLARCIASKPRLILLSDNFNQLRSDDIKMVLDYLLKSKATVVAISNNPAIAKQFNRSLVLKNGKLIGNDSVNELANKDWYTNVFQGI